jgi:hypothetical protein
LERSVPLTIPAALRATILDDNEGDALDSVVAAVAVSRTLRSESPTVRDNAAYTVEGYVYL